MQRHGGEKEMENDRSNPFAHIYRDRYKITYHPFFGMRSVAQEKAAAKQALEMRKEEMAIHNELMAGRGDIYSSVSNQCNSSGGDSDNDKLLPYEPLHTFVFDEVTDLGGTFARSRL